MLDQVQCMLYFPPSVDITKDQKSTALDLDHRQLFFPDHVHWIILLLCALPGHLDTLASPWHSRILSTWSRGIDRRVFICGDHYLCRLCMRNHSRYHPVANGHEHEEHDCSVVRPGLGRSGSSNDDLSPAIHCLLDPQDQYEL